MVCVWAVSHVATGLVALDLLISHVVHRELVAKSSGGMYHNDILCQTKVTITKIAFALEVTVGSRSHWPQDRLQR
eukprot:COSAG02_NODE_443_length_22233_cov_69.528870_14_plen_75_part_00